MVDDNRLANTTRLLEQLRAGDESARERLIARYLPRLRQWAHGRLPHYGRDLSETDDLVQITLLRAVNRLDDFESRRPGAFLAYLRTILMNVVREELRRRGSRPPSVSLVNSLPSDQLSVVEETVGAEMMQRYERALAKLPETKRLAVMMRVEFDMSFPEIADELEQPSANSTRMMVGRALSDLADMMSE